MSDANGVVVAIFVGYRAAVSMIKACFTGTGHAGKHWNVVVEPIWPTGPQWRTGVLSPRNVFSPVNSLHSHQPTSSRDRQAYELSSSKSFCFSSTSPPTILKSLGTEHGTPCGGVEAILEYHPGTRTILYTQSRKT